MAKIIFSILIISALCIMDISSEERGSGFSTISCSDGIPAGTTGTSICSQCSGASSCQSCTKVEKKTTGAKTEYKINCITGACSAAGNLFSSPPSGTTFESCKISQEAISTDENTKYEIETCCQPTRTSQEK